MALYQHWLTKRLVLFSNIPTYDSGEEFAALCAPEAAALYPLHAAAGQVKRLLPRNQFSRQLFYRHLTTTHPHLVLQCGTREMENISRDSAFGDYVTILTERSRRDVTVERSQVIFTAIAITRKIVQCSCVPYIGYHTLCTVFQ